MNIRWIALAEGIAQDAKGAYSLIGLNQNVLFADRLPTQTKRAVIVHLEGSATDAAAKMESASFTFLLESPSGSTLTAQSGQIEGAAFPFPDLPASADIPFDVMVPIPEYGAYSLRFQISYATGESETSAVQLFVLPASENPQFKSALAAVNSA